MPVVVSRGLERCSVLTAKSLIKQAETNSSQAVILLVLIYSTSCVESGSVL